MKPGVTAMMLYELDDIEKRALVMEIKPQKDPVDEARELLSKATPGPWGVLPSNNSHLAHVETQEGTTAEQGQGFTICSINKKRIDDAELIAAAPRLLNSLIARIESQAEDIRFLGDRLEVQADVMSKVVAERNQLREQLKTADDIHLVTIEARIDADRDNFALRQELTQAAIEAHVGWHHPKPWDVCDLASCNDRKRLIGDPTALSAKGEQK